MRAAAMMALTLLAVAPSRGLAQHAELVAGTEWKCGLCHGSHGGEPGAYNLKTDNVEVWGPAGRLSAVSRSCLRCHASPDLRRRQPEMAALPRDADERGYLGADLSQQHPLGPIDLIRSRTPFAPLRPTRRTAPRSVSGPAGASIECTTCHDPHQADDPDQEFSRETCGTCHDAVTYQLGHEDVACTACHQVHDAAPRAALLTGGQTDLVCRRCHEPSGAAQPLKLAAPEAHAGDPTTASRNCRSCHTLHR